MVLTADERRAALERARERHAAGDYVALVAELDGIDPDALLAEPELGVLLVLGRRRVGEPERAFELVRRLDPVCGRRGNDRVARWRLNLEAALLFERGEIDEARRAWLRLLEASSAADDAEFEAHANNNLGTIHTLQGPEADALVSYERAIAAYRRLGERRGLAQAHHNAALVYRELGFLREADAHFRQAIGYARTVASEDIVARAERNRALVLLLRGDLRFGEATARRALRRFERLREPAGIAASHCALGFIALARGDHPATRRHQDRAVELARQTRQPLLEAEALEALAALEDADGESRRALQATADELFESLGASRWGARLRARLAALAASGSSLRPVRAVHPPRRE